MVTETPKDDEPLIPVRHVQGDLFICDVSDAVLKDLIPQMEHPFYSLSKKPETAIRRYEHNGNWLQITPSVKGLATIYDKDILIYCISQLIEKMKRGEKVGARLRINSYDLLVFTNRGTAGKDYNALVEAIDRLAGTRISTNIRTGDEEQTDNFGLIDAASIRRKHGLDGRLLWVEIKLSEWVLNAIQSQEVLTLHRDYFRLRKPLERRQVRGAGMLALMGVCDLVGTTLSGWLSDRFNNRVLLFWYYGLRGLALIFLPVAFGYQYFGLPLFGLFYGLDWIATVPPTVRLTTDVFGSKDAPVVFGWVVAGHQLGAAFAALGAGMLRSTLGSYTLATMIAGGLCVAAALLVLRINRPSFAPAVASV